MIYFVYTNLVKYGVLSLFFLSEGVHMFAIALVVLGTVIMLIGFFGCCGAIRENQCCLGIFFVLLFLCFLLTVAIGGWLQFPGDDIEFDYLTC